MFIVLILRFAFTKTERDPYHQLGSGYLWYDRSSTATDQAFMGYALFGTYKDWFRYCKDREDTADRTIIALAPSGNPIINSIKTRLDTDLAPYGLTVKLYNSRDEIMNIIGASGYEKDGNPGICFGAAFTQSETNNYRVNMIFDDILTERTDDPNMPNQELPAVDEYQRKPNFEAFDQYRKGGYTYLQNIIANAILRNSRGNGAYISMVYTGMKTSKYNDDDFATAATSMWNFFMLIIFIAPLYRFLYNSVAEKETKVREAMKIMGLTDFPYWLSWLSYYVVITTIQCIVMVLILIPVFEYSNLFLIFLYLWLYGMTMFAFGLFIGSFFSTAKTAAIVGTMAFYITSFISPVVEDRSVSEAAKTVTSFFPSVGVQLGGINLLKFEEVGIGMNFDNASEVYLNYRFAT